MGNRENKEHWQSMELPEFSIQYVGGQGPPAEPNQPDEPSKKPEEPAKKSEYDDRTVCPGPDNGKKPEQQAEKPESDDTSVFPGPDNGEKPKAKEPNKGEKSTDKTELCFPTTSGSKSRNVKADAGKETEDY